MKIAQIHEKSSATKNTGSFFKPAIQKKLSVGASNDSYEVEADCVADKVMRMANPSNTAVTHTGSLVQRKCAACEQEEKIQKKPLAESIQRVSNSTSEASTAPSHVESQINNSRGGGSSMDHGTKNFMESRFGTDFSDVKIHTGSQAIQMSRDLNAQAFTVGNDIYFNEGKYSPNSDSGKHLLAHELTHTVQQTGGVGRKIQMQRRGRRIPQRCGINSLRNSNYPDTFISAIDVNLSTQSLHVRWHNRTPPRFRNSTDTDISSGAGLCSLNCNDEATSRRGETACTPIGSFIVHNINDCTLDGHPKAKFPTRFSRSGIAIHSGKGLKTPRSHGCVRTSLRMAQMIQENVIVNQTIINVTGTGRRLFCYNSISDDQPVPRRRMRAR